MSDAPVTPAPTSATVAARAIDLCKLYGEGSATIAALDGVTVDFSTAEFTAVMGPSGSGKSTLMHCMAALDTATSGEVYLGDQELAALDDKALTMLRRDQIGFIFQAYNLLPTLDAKENILLPLSIAGRKPDKEWFDTVIRAVDLGSRLKHRPSELSGGAAAAGRLRPGARLQARDRLRGRADRQPRLDSQRRGAGLPAQERR